MIELPQARIVVIPVSAEVLSMLRSHSFEEEKVYRVEEERETTRLKHEKKKVDTIMHIRRNIAVYIAVPSGPVPSPPGLPAVSSFT